MCEKNNLELGVEATFEDMSEEEIYPLIEEQMELLALAEETSRLSNLKNDYEVSEETAKDKFFKEGMVVAETITAMVKKMVNNGIDYTNAIQIANNYFCAVNEKDAIVKMNKVNKVGGF